VEAERRQVTVLFTDMVGFTIFSERSGEEAAFTLMQSLAKPMEDAVRAQGGAVQGFTGDGIMAVFGAPVAHERHLITRQVYKQRRSIALAEWRALAA
jgi:class 3 adenylate cyclase